jgi:hypothetical protein
LNETLKSLNETQLNESLRGIPQNPNGELAGKFGRILTDFIQRFENQTDEESPVRTLRNFALNSEVIE